MAERQTVTLTYREAEQALGAIIELSKDKSLPVRAISMIARLRKELFEACKTFKEIRQSLIEQHTKLDKDGNPIKADPKKGIKQADTIDDLELLNAKIEEALDEEACSTKWFLSADVLGLNRGDRGDTNNVISGEQVYALGDLWRFEEEE